MAHAEGIAKAPPSAVGLYPWGRYWAKVIDAYLTGLALGVLYPPIASSAGMLLLTGAIFFPPVEAICISLFGTTPGKAAFRISVLGRDDQMLRLPDSLRRSYGSWIMGGAAGIPILGWIAAWMAYRDFTTRRVTAWDERASRFVASRPTWGSWLWLALAGAVYLTLAVMAEMHKLQGVG